MKKIGAVFAVFAMLTVCIGSFSADSHSTFTAYADVNENGYDLSGFGWRFPEVFSKDDTVILTENSYQSHDVCIEMTKYVSPYLSGDLTGDHAVSLEDAVLCCKCLAEDASVFLTEAGVHNADCDVNGMINADDVRQMLSYLSAAMTAEDFFVESSLVYHIADIYIRDIHSFRGCFAKDVFPPKGSCLFEYATTVAQNNNALLLINADYVECRYTGIIYRNGVHYRDLTYGSDVCVLFDDGEMDVMTSAEYFALPDERKAQIWQTSNFYKGLVKDGVAQPFNDVPNSSSIQSSHPRSSVGYYEPGHYVFVQVDGRQAGYSKGMYLSELAALYVSLGVQEAYNLDGGSSSSLVFNGNWYNTPAPVHVGDTQLGRPTSDFFFICEPSQIPEDLAAEAWGDNPPETTIPET